MTSGQELVIYLIYPRFIYPFIYLFIYLLIYFAWYILLTNNAGTALRIEFVLYGVDILWYAMGFWRQSRYVRSRYLYSRLNTTWTRDISSLFWNILWHAMGFWGQSRVPMFGRNCDTPWDFEVIRDLNIRDKLWHTMAFWSQSSVQDKMWHIMGFWRQASIRDERKLVFSVLQNA